MTSEIYQPPKSEVVNGVAGVPMFYVVSPKKYLLLYFSTLGTYHVYWFYKNWSLFKASNGGTQWPVMRGIFSIFFAHGLFRLIEGRLKQLGKEFAGSPSSLATLYVIYSLLGNVLDSLSGKGIGSPYTDLSSLCLMPLICWTLYRAQLSANLACGDEKGEVNEVLTPLNYLWIVLGVFLWGFVLIGVYEMMVGIPA